MDASGRRIRRAGRAALRETNVLESGLYSSVDPPLTTKAKALIWSRAVIALAAGATALMTL